ncbi:MAG TPA: hypothetical protein VGW78_07740 [Candidatus Babeliales bacterium]|jgi:hypothetical protein|nr:hypothetical protein [Candidatus Babeliales bacterium]
MHKETKMGRPTKYTPELAEEIADALACSSQGLRTLCSENPHWPDRRNIYRWLKRHDEFRKLYTQAKITQIDSLVDDILEIANNSENDTYYDEEGNAKCNVEWVNRCRLRIDVYKWLAAKLVPRIFGDAGQFPKSPEDDHIKKDEYDFSLLEKDEVEVVEKLLRKASVKKPSESGSN